jgi:hypothetical protein
MQLARARHAFLLRLGVWEIPPVEAFHDLRDRSEARFPHWEGRLHQLQQEIIEKRGGWCFGGAAYEHEAVCISDDYRLLWDLPDSNAVSLARAIGRGTKLYTELGRLSAFCPRCKTHTTRYRLTAADNYPSLLSLQIRHGRWLPCTRDGADLPEPVSATEAWWEPKAPDSQFIKQSPLRYLDLVRRDCAISEELRRFALLPQLEDAGSDRILSLLISLRRAFEDGTLTPAVESSTAKQTFVGIHRMAYARLGEIAATSPVKVLETLSEIGLLCDVGDSIAFRTTGDARHDDGRFASYRRHFSGLLPFVAIARDKEALAARLGVKPFLIEIKRHLGGDERDVTGDLDEFLRERAVELLAIVVHHSLGTQTLQLESQQFQERSRRLFALRVVQVQNLVLDAGVVGTELTTVIGEGAESDLFLEGPSSANPILYHDLSGDGWQERLRRRIAPHLAAVLENPNYSDTFALFLQEETDAEREKFLYERGITPEDVGNVRDALGMVSDVDRALALRWFRAILSIFHSQSEGENDGDLQAIEAALVAAGVPAASAAYLIKLGGRMDVRTESGPGGALRTLADAGVDLRALHEALLASGDPGLAIRVATDRLREWRHRFGKQIAAVLATKSSEAHAKARPDRWTVPANLRFDLDPVFANILDSVVADLRAVGLNPDVQRLCASDPSAEMVRLAGCKDVVELNSLVARLYDAEERDQLLREQAREWRRTLLSILVLVRTAPHEPPSVIRAHAELVNKELLAYPQRPSDLASSVTDLLVNLPSLATALVNLLVDNVVVALPSREEIAEILVAHKVDITRMERVDKAMLAPAREKVRRIREQLKKLDEAGIRIRPPKLSETALKNVPPAPPRRTIPMIRVELGEAKRRRLGDEGERWALAAILPSFVSIDLETRRKRIDELAALLRNFGGTPVDVALGHAEAARAADLDDDELIDELTGFLHVSRQSDSFGFDMLGWLSPAESAAPRAMCVEVKSSGSEEFHLSSAEWKRAEEFREQYGILVVRRGKGDSSPKRMDLLVDPVALCQQLVLSRHDDGYVLRYKSV